MDHMLSKPVELDKMIAELTAMREMIGEGSFNPGYMQDKAFDFDNLPWVTRSRAYAVKAAITKMLRDLCRPNDAKQDNQNYVGVTFPRGAFQTDHKTNDALGVGGTVNKWTIRIRSLRDNDAIFGKRVGSAKVSFKNPKVMNFETTYRYNLVGAEWESSHGIIRFEAFTDLETIFKEITELHTLMKMYAH